MSTLRAERVDVSERLAGLYAGRWLQGYVRWKVRTDRAYAAALEILRGRQRPIVDIGCGVGVLPFYLREHGIDAPVIGIDFDERKIDVARKAATRYRGIDFIAGDARAPLPAGHDFVLLDVLHYFDEPSRRVILDNVARAAGVDDVVIVRQAIADGSWRHRLTQAIDALARVFRWMKAERLDFPTREEIVARFEGFDASVRPLRGRMMPYNNYLFVFRRSALSHASS